MTIIDARRRVLTLILCSVLGAGATCFMARTFFVALRPILLPLAWMFGGAAIALVVALVKAMPRLVVINPVAVNRTMWVVYDRAGRQAVKNCPDGQVAAIARYLREQMGVDLTAEESEAFVRCLMRNGPRFGIKFCHRPFERPTILERI